MKSINTTVIMPAFNSETFLKKAIDSILSQTYKNFELIVINDASSDSSLKILKKAQKKDKRIKIFSNKKKLGITSSLNRGLKMAKGKYVMRMDADDISCKERLQKQIDFLESHPNIWVVGCGIQYINSQGKILNKIKYLTDPDLISFQKLFFNPLAHPTACYRKEIVIRLGGYRNKHPHAEDFDLWSRIPKNKIANLSEILLYYRTHNQSISRSEGTKKTQSTSSLKIVKNNLAKYGQFTYDDAKLLRLSFSFSFNYFILSIKQQLILFRLFRKYANKEKVKFKELVRIIWFLRIYNPIYLLIGEGINIVIRKLLKK